MRTVESDLGNLHSVIEENDFSEHLMLSKKLKCQTSKYSPSQKVNKNNLQHVRAIFVSSKAFNAL